MGKVSLTNENPKINNSNFSKKLMHKGNINIEMNFVDDNTWVTTLIKKFPSGGGIIDSNFIKSST